MAVTSGDFPTRPGAHATWLRPASRADLPALHEMRRAAERWLAGKGTDQYQSAASSAKARVNITELVAARHFVIHTNSAGDLLATAALTAADLDFWNDGDDLACAWYLSRLMVSQHGCDWGGRLLDLVCAGAATTALAYLRLDCWRDNFALHDYYRAHGFNLVRIEAVSGRRSGALMQRPLLDALPQQ